ncbi:DUF2913 family protein [Erwinia sp. P6884]|uniref:DUF2913 family protein n=1 Tax=Erwinia sp. P6884 TaxID=3141450 RepID=UPI00318F7A61
MKRNRINPDILNFSWSLLVALSLYEQNGKKSPLQQHMFIMRWLETALKKKLLPKSVAGELNWFIDEGRRLGFRAGLRAKAEYLWHTGTEDQDTLSDLSRFTHFFEAMKMLGWRDVLVTDQEWALLSATNASIPTVWLRNTALRSSFDLYGNMSAPLEIKLNKGFEGIFLLADDADLDLVISGVENNLMVMRISC